MELVRTWVRWTSTALGASLLVPAAVMIVAAGVAIGGGGLGGIGALGQLVEGPRDPLAAVQALDPADDTLAADPSALITTTPSDDFAALNGGSGDTPGAGDRDGSGGGDTGGGAPGGGERGGGTPGGGNGGGDNGEAPGGGGGRGGSEQPANPAPELPSGPLQGVDQGAGEIVEQLPEPVGPISGDVIDQVVELGEQILGSPEQLLGQPGGLLGDLNGP